MHKQQVSFVDSSGLATDIDFRCKTHELGTPHNSSLILSLLPSMFGSRPLKVDGDVDSLLLENVSEAQIVLQRFFNWRRLYRREFYGPNRRAEARRVKVEAPVAPEQAQASGVGCFFTGGLDSFYTLLEHQDEITHLVFILGYDVPTHSPLAQEVVERLQVIARTLNKELIVLESDLRKTSDRFIHWHMYHGSALCAAGQLLSPHLGKIFVPSTYTYEDLVPLGSHPLLDPLWNTHWLQFEHHGLGQDRAQKALKVGQCEVACEHLRVCWKNPKGLYNCGRCEKCVRTLVEFEVAGHGQRLKSVPGPLSYAHIERLSVDPLVVKFWRASHRMALQRQDQPELLLAIEKRMRQTPWKWLRYLPSRLLKEAKFRLKNLLSALTYREQVSETSNQNASNVLESP